MVSFPTFEEISKTMGYEEGNGEGSRGTKRTGGGDKDYLKLLRAVGLSSLLPLRVTKKRVQRNERLAHKYFSSSTAFKTRIRVLNFDFLPTEKNARFHMQWVNPSQGVEVEELQGEAGFFSP